MPIRSEFKVVHGRPLKFFGGGNILGVKFETDGAGTTESAEKYNC